MKFDDLPFSDLLCEVIDNRGKTCPTAETGIPLIATNCIRNELLYPTYDRVRFVSSETYSTWFRGHPKPGDILFVNKATPGRVCLVPDPVDFCIAQDMVAVRADPDKVYPKYLFAVLRSPLIQERIQQMHVGSLIPHFKKGDFDKLRLPIPNRRTQEYIGNLYFDISGKIDINRRMNETLEMVIRALFKNWFIDFGPVHAKMEGRWQRDQSLPGLPAHLYDLFPERLVESGLGETPEGWQMRSLDSIASYLNGLALQKFPPESETEFLPVIKIAQLRAGNTNRSDRASRHIKPEYVVVDGDVLFSWSGSLEVEVWNGGRGALNQHLFKVTSNEVPKWFYFFATRQHLSDFRAIAAGKATTMGHIQRKHLTEARIAVAPLESMKKFDAVIASQFDQLISSAQQSRVLAQLRDTLLPKLISGELRISDAERFLGEVERA